MSKKEVTRNGVDFSPIEITWKKVHRNDVDFYPIEITWKNYVGFAAIEIMSKKYVEMMYQHNIDIELTLI